ncbi:MAG: hypothetical protein HC819_01440 [Cyclobacteriaceae bacterium]|nr:hypothetical protein [Cyclobacteriaceae bacterium]
MEIVLELGKIVLPAALVLYAMFLTMKSMLAKEVVKANLEFKIAGSKVALPNRLQAFERMSLFLERLSPGNLVLRLNSVNMSAKQLQQVMIAEIREEFNHNLSQQIYMSDKSWGLIKNTVEDVIALINTNAEKLGPEARSVELAKLIFNELEKREVDPVAVTLSEIKAEIRDIF